MKKSLLVAAALCSVALAGCAHHKGYHGRYTPRLPLETRTNPQVAVENGQIVVSPNIILLAAGEGPQTVTWRLPEGGKLRFDERGIVIEGELLDRVIRDNRAVAQALNPDQTEITCPKDGVKPFEVRCQVRNSKFGVFKYTLRVLDGNTLLTRDPPIVTGANM